MRRLLAPILVLLACGVGAGWWLGRPERVAGGQAGAALDRVVPVVRFRQQTLERVLRECERVAGVPIAVNWAVLRGEGVTPETPVTLHRYDNPLADILRRIAGQLPSGDHGILFVDEGDRIILDRSDRVLGPSVVRTYDVADVLDGVPWLDDIVEEVPVGCFGDSLAGAGPAVPEDPYLRRREELLSLITETVDPDSWRVNGGSAGEIRYAGDHLVVVQTVGNQNSLADVLDEVRRSDGHPYIWPGPWREDAAWQALLARQAAVDIHLDGVTFAQALDRVRETFRANIELDEDLPEDAGFNFSRPVTLHLRTPSLGEAVLALGACIAPAREPAGLAPDPRGNGLILCTARAAGTDVCTEYYDLRPLLGENPAPEAYEELVLLGVFREVEPDSWRDNGGRLGAVGQPYRGRALVTQSRENHRLLRRWLDARLADFRRAAGNT